jgi:protein tyrosine phosphatase (PTP) superfamily phosphohydrolase (DUF442 family)
MRRLVVVLFLLLLMVALLGGCSSGPGVRTDPVTEIDTDSVPVPVEGISLVTGHLYRDGRVFIAGQPSRKALGELIDRGVTTIVNVRTAKEMDDREKVPFDEAAIADSLGVAYVQIELGDRDHPYRPEVLATLDEVMKDRPGLILLHCRSGSRVSYVWAGYLVKYRGWDLADGFARGQAIGIKDHPVGLLLDKNITLDFQ